MGLFTLLDRGRGTRPEWRRDNNNNKLDPYIYIYIYIKRERVFRKRQGGNRGRVFHSTRLVLRFCQFLVVTRGIVNASNNKFPPSESSRFAFPAAVLRCGFYQGKPSYLRARAPSTTPSASPPFVLKDGAEPCRSPDLNRPLDRGK